MCQPRVYIGIGMLTEHEPYNGLVNVPRKFEAQDPDERRWFTKLQPRGILKGIFSPPHLDLRYFMHNGK